MLVTSEDPKKIEEVVAPILGEVAPVEAAAGDPAAHHAPTPPLTMAQMRVNGMGHATERSTCSRRMLRERRKGEGVGLHATRAFS